MSCIVMNTKSHFIMWKSEHLWTERWWSELILMKKLGLLGWWSRFNFRNYSLNQESSRNRNLRSTLCVWFFFLCRPLPALHLCLSLLGMRIWMASGKHLRSPIPPVKRPPAAVHGRDQWSTTPTTRASGSHQWLTTLIIR